MKTKETILADFIHDFNLEGSGGAVCFEASLEFSSVNLSKKFIGEVHIVTMAQKDMSVVYLLQEELSLYGIPDVLPFDADNFLYEKNYRLMISDYDLLRGKYNLSIFPVKVNSLSGLKTI